MAQNVPANKVLETKRVFGWISAGFFSTERLKIDGDATAEDVLIPQTVNLAPDVVKIRPDQTRLVGTTTANVKQLGNENNVDWVQFLDC